MIHQKMNQTKNAIAPKRQQEAIAPSLAQNPQHSPHPIEELQSSIGNRAVNQRLTNQPIVQAKPLFRGLSHELLVQPKLMIGTPGDKYEQEADLVAKQAVSQINGVENSRIQQLEIQGRDSEALQRSANRNFPLRMKPTIQHLSPDSMAVTPELETSIQESKGGGQPLSNTIRQPMEDALKADFSGVKVHTDNQSDRLNQSIQSRAFTTEKDIFFRRGTYNPESRAGQELIAHELTHVVQQQSVLKPIVQRDIIIGEWNDNTITTSELQNHIKLQISNQNNQDNLEQKVNYIRSQIDNQEFKYIGEINNIISELATKFTTEAEATEVKEITETPKPKRHPSTNREHQMHRAKSVTLQQQKLAELIYLNIANKMTMWASSTGGVAILAPIKSISRILEKLKAKSEEQLEKKSAGKLKTKVEKENAPFWDLQMKDVKDTLRGSILYENMRALYEGAKKIKNAPDQNNPILRVIKANELFTHPKKDGGYRDIKIVFAYRIDEAKEIPIELQLNLAQNVVVKEGKQFSQPLKLRWNKSIPNWFDTQANYHYEKQFNAEKYLRNLEKRIPTELRHSISDKMKELSRLIDKYGHKIIPLSHTIYEREQQRKSERRDRIANKIYKLLFDIEQILGTPGTTELPDLRNLGFDDANPPPRN